MVEIVAEGIEPRHFSVEENSILFAALQHIYNNNMQPTPEIVYSILQNNLRDKIDKIGGVDYIDAVMSSFAPKDNLKFHIKEVMNVHSKELLADLAESIIDQLDKKDVDELINETKDSINELATQGIITEQVYKMGTGAEEVLRLRAENPSAIPGLTVGWEHYDKLTNGAQPGDLIMICARSKVGKSALLLNFATNLALTDVPVLYIDTEMSSRQQEDRLLSRLSDIPEKEIISGMYAVDTEYGTAEEKTERLEMARELIASKSFHHTQMADFTVEKVESTIIKYKLEHNIGAVFFDYIKLPSSSLNSLRSSQEYQILGYLANKLKELAANLEIPIFSACQENRTGIGSTEKDASNVGGSDRILQTATKLMFLYNKSQEQLEEDGLDKGNQQLYIAYQRSGESDCAPINVMYNRPYISMREIS